MHESQLPPASLSEEPPEPAPPHAEDVSSQAVGGGKTTGSHRAGALNDGRASKRGGESSPESPVIGGADHESSEQESSEQEYVVNEEGDGDGDLDSEFYEEALSDDSPSSLEVLIANETDVEVDEDLLARAVQAVVAQSVYSCGEISVAVIDDPAMHELNRQYLAHDYPTDVLSFPLTDDPPRVDGEIVVSVDTAAREASLVGWDAASELVLYVVHGALHLVGHLDKRDDDVLAMRRAERETLSALGIEVAAGDARWSVKPDDDFPGERAACGVDESRNAKKESAQ
ncbi:MAG: rRNA maturation RNase YbeY [Planctomycetales bacterium]|nr:rRNA maturation RNase YbeY [Planctomycetales bacterium]